MAGATKVYPTLYFSRWRVLRVELLTDATTLIGRATRLREWSAQKLSKLLVRKGRTSGNLASPANNTELSFTIELRGQGFPQIPARQCGFSRSESRNLIAFQELISEITLISNNSVAAKNHGYHPANLLF
jgi:hypothetical protein